jgi:IS30 family transposase
LTSAAIARSLDEPPGTIRTRIRRGRELLRAAVEAATADRALAGRAAGEIERWDRAPEATS